MTIAQPYTLNQIDEETPAIYVACLASYNAGKLFGQWIDCTQGYDHVMEEIKAMLANSEEDIAEDWEIHTYHGFKGIKLDQWESIEKVCEIGEKLEEYEDLADVLALLYNEYCDIDEAARMLEDNYIGCFESEQDFIYQYVDDTCILEGISDHIKRYFDYNAFLKDLEYSGDIFSVLVGYKQHHYFHNS